MLAPKRVPEIDQHRSKSADHHWQITFDRVGSPFVAAERFGHVFIPIWGGFGTEFGEIWDRF